MPGAKTYLVPIDFSRGSDAALNHVLTLVREDKGRIVLLHVIPTETVFLSQGMPPDYYGVLEREARSSMTKLLQRKKMKPMKYRLVFERATDIGWAIAHQAKKLRASMIVMGSHGRSGLQRLLLGSVAERTLRYAECPVLIVKK
jgi:nucleotide-binding universal stress UspA family protein